MTNAERDFRLDEAVADTCQAIIVELQSDQRPPTSLATLNKPMIAIRRGVAFNNLHEARAACDRLQAELAPEFDLAGYVVGP